MKELKELLLAEHSKAQCNKIVDYVGNNASRFKNLVHFFIDEDKLLSQRAAWPFSYAAAKNPQLVQPYFPLLTEALKRKGSHFSVYRNILRAFEEIDIPEKFQSDVFDICIGFFTSEYYPPAVRAFAISVSAKIAKKYPELKNELRILIVDLRKHSASPAINVRIKRALKSLGE